MDINEAKNYVNSKASLVWTDRHGSPLHDDVFVYEVNFVPLYGPCFITSKGDIRLDRVVACAHVEDLAA